MSVRISVAIGVLFLVASCGCVEEPDEQQTVLDERPKQETDQQHKELVAQARQAAKEGDFETAIQVGEEALATNRQDADLLGLLAETCQRHAIQLARRDRDGANACFVKSADYMRDLRDVTGGLDATQRQFFGMALYNAACAHAIGGDQKKALASLEEAFAEGFPDIGLAETDADLAGLHETPEFEALIEDARKKLMERLREEARQELAAFEPFEFSFVLPDTKGEAVSLDDFKGNVVIVDIWGTWCPPCRQEVPHFIELHRKYGEQGLKIVGINYEQGPESEWAKKIESFIAQYGVTYPCVIGDRSTQEMVPQFGAFPTTLFVDRTGTVRAKLVGYHPYEKLEAIVLELLAEGTAGS